MIISHDLGTTGNKATLVDTTGHVVTTVTVPYDSDFGSHGKAEQNAEDWWRALCEATRRLLDASPGAREKIAAVSFSGQMMGAVLLDSDGAPVRPAIIWADTRSSAQAAQLVERVGMERGYAITGHRLNPTYSLSKVMWVRDNEPDIFERVSHVVCAKDFVAYRLTGVIATDPSDASGTNAFDQSVGEWSEELLHAAGVSTDLFPDIVPSTAIIGKVTASAAAETGLLMGTPVVMGGGDGPMAALGSGIISASSGAYAYLGSSSWVSFAADAPLHDPEMRTMTFNHVIPGSFVPTATMQAGGASLQWIVESLEPERSGNYKRLLNSASHADACTDGLYFLPHLLGERSPYWNPQARAAFIGLARHHGPANLVRAVVEGVAFNLQTSLEAFASNGADIRSIDAIGGAANSAELLQIFSDVWGRPIRRRALVDEATALGAAVVGGVAVGMFPSFEVAGQLSALTGEFQPSPERHSVYVASHRRFLDAYRRLEPWFADQ
ncbi:xylulokinase [Cryobacterium glaciale]|uniref:Xylulose kinase n=1 Tax=Cryobacterium glaciale TaxID=1259145 RepID=A0A4R8V193_9MICO|nr:xylulokinase [Cryobacterium glaciale]TFB74994.1 xylulokinase [Cryobacterium glaciale]